MVREKTGINIPVCVMLFNYCIIGEIFGYAWPEYLRSNLNLAGSQIHLYEVVGLGLEPFAAGLCV